MLRLGLVDIIKEQKCESCCSSNSASTSMASCSLMYLVSSRRGTIKPFVPMQHKLTNIAEIPRQIGSLVAGTTIHGSHSD